MTKDVILSLIRTLLTAFGAFLFGKNVFGTTLDSTTWEIWVGALLTLGSTIWGIVDKTSTIEAVQSGLRSVFTVGGGILVAMGKLTGQTLDSVVGLIAPIVTFLYSALSKQKNAQIASGVLKATTNSIGQTDLKKVA